MIERLESRLLLSDGTIPCQPLFMPPVVSPIFPTLSNGTLTITGTSGKDRINVTSRGKSVQVFLDRWHFAYSKKTSNISKIIINSLGGDDRIDMHSSIDASIDGGDGKDLIHSGGGDDVLLGGNGNDRLFGGNGDDAITGGAGRDMIAGGAGEDQINTADGRRDNLSGGHGKDTATVDDHGDRGSSIEDYLSMQSAGPTTAFTFRRSALSLAPAAGAGTFRLVTVHAADPGPTGGVTISDFIDLASNYGGVGGGATWQEGDLNYDRPVTITDFIDLASHFNTCYAPPVTAGAGSVIGGNLSGAFGSNVTVNAGKLNLSTITKTGSGTLTLSNGSTLGGSGSIGGAVMVSNSDLSDLGGVGSGDYVLIDYNNAAPLTDSLTHLDPNFHIVLHLPPSPESDSGEVNSAPTT